MLSNTFAAGIVLALVQCLLALPWVLLLFHDSPKETLRKGEFWGKAFSVFASVAVVIVGLIFVVKDRGNTQLLGKVYGAIVHAQILADLFVLAFAVVLATWPKGGAVAVAAFREAVRQPLFWLVCLMIVGLLILMPFIPYFTFGEDHLMARDLGLEVIMLLAVVFTSLVAGMSISEEIEGRTAVTLMSKPVSRRQFLLGKFLGILLAGLVMTSGMNWGYCWMMDFKHYYERVHWYEVQQATPFPSGMAAVIQHWFGTEGPANFVRGIAVWGMDSAEAIPGLVLGSCHVMVILAVAVCLATRLPVAANLLTCVVIFVLGHLSPTIRQAAEAQAASDPSGGSVATTMLRFVAQVFELFLPGLQLFSPTRITDVPIAVRELVLYSGEVAAYTLMYTLILLLLGLILFEDRDLA